MFEVSFSQASSLNSFFFLFSALLNLVQWWFVSASCRVRICWFFSFFLFLFFFLFAFPLMGKTEWGGNPVCWWLGLFFCFVCCLDEASCTGCYWWLGDARFCIQVVSFVGVLTIWYSLGFKWALESITTNKASGGDGIPVELFQTLKDDAVKVLHSICQQIGKTQQWPQC